MLLKKNFYLNCFENVKMKNMGIYLLLFLIIRNSALIYFSKSKKGIEGSFNQGTRIKGKEL